MDEFDTLEPIAVDNIEPDLYDDGYDDEPCEPDNWADADALASAGWGTSEDYGFYGEDY